MLPSALQRSPELRMLPSRTRTHSDVHTHFFLPQGHSYKSSEIYIKLWVAMCMLNMCFWIAHGIQKYYNRYSNGSNALGLTQKRLKVKWKSEKTVPFSPLTLFVALSISSSLFSSLDFLNIVPVIYLFSALSSSLTTLVYAHSSVTTLFED